MKKKSTKPKGSAPPSITAYPKDRIKILEKQLKEQAKKIEKIQAKKYRGSEGRTPVLFPIGKKRQQLAQMMGYKSGYSPALLESWEPQQTLFPVSKSSRPLTANTLYEKAGMQMTVPYFHNPEQDLDYIIYEDEYHYTAGGPILRELVKFIVGRGFKPKLVPRKEIDSKEELELIKKHRGIIDNLKAVEDNISYSNSHGLDMSFQEKITRILLNTCVFNRACGLYGYETPVVIDGTEYHNIPSSFKDIHSRDMGVIEIDNETWKLKKVQIQQYMQIKNSGLIDINHVFYLWNPVLSGPAYQGMYYGTSLMRNMSDELRTMRRLVGVNFPTYADAVHTGIPVITIDPEGMTETERANEGQQISESWSDGTPNLLYKDPEKTRIDNITFDPKIKEFIELYTTLERSCVTKSGLPQSLFSGENDANRDTLRHRIQLAISVNINPIRAWLERAIADQCYQKWFTEMYDGSEEHKLFRIGVEFEDLQIETLEDRINTAVEIHENLAPMTIDGMGEYLQDPNFHTKIDLKKFNEMNKQQSQKMKIQNKSTGEKYVVSTKEKSAVAAIKSIEGL